VEGNRAYVVSVRAENQVGARWSDHRGAVNGPSPQVGRTSTGGAIELFALDLDAQAASAKLAYHVTVDGTKECGMPAVLGGGVVVLRAQGALTARSKATGAAAWVAPSDASLGNCRHAPVYLACGSLVAVDDSRGSLLTFHAAGGSAGWSVLPKVYNRQTSVAVGAPVESSATGDLYAWPYEWDMGLTGPLSTIDCASGRVGFSTNGTAALSELACTPSALTMSPDRDTAFATCGAGVFALQQPAGGAGALLKPSWTATLGGEANPAFPPIALSNSTVACVTKVSGDTSYRAQALRLGIDLRTHPLPWQDGYLEAWTTSSDPPPPPPPGPTPAPHHKGKDPAVVPATVSAVVVVVVLALALVAWFKRDWLRARLGRGGDGGAANEPFLASVLA
jgi:hypothetical protein